MAENNFKYDCIIIGGGAAGLFCGATFPCRIKGLILEKSRRPGRKLLMSGSGQCNITHSGSIKDFVPCYGKNGGRIRSCLFKYNNSSLTDFLEANGVPTVTRPDGKVFPASMKAEDILKMLLHQSEKNGFELLCKSGVTGIKIEPDNSYLVESESKCYRTKKLIIATGGCSYPTTGSDGNFFRILTDLGIGVSELRPALSPISVENYKYGELSGVSFKSAEIAVWRDEKRISVRRDDLLFTHTSLSGPGILNISKYVRPGDTLKINYLADYSYESALSKVTAALAGKMSAANSLSAVFGLPKSFCSIVANECGTSSKSVTAKLTADTLSVKNTDGFNKAMVTSGGVVLDELNLKTMELKKLPGCFCIGEAVDIDGETGGYNLQFAYSSARAANQS